VAGRFGSITESPRLGRFSFAEVVPMIAPVVPLTCLQSQFLALLPRLERHGRVCFRSLKCPDRKAEALAEVVALAWRWFVRLAQRGKDASAFGSALATYAARAVQSGRRLCGQQKSKDVLSPLAQQRRGFTVGPLPATSSLEGNVFDEALHDNAQTPVPEQAAFRCDFPAWLQTRAERDRRLALDLMAGERTADVSDRYGLSPARVSQLRRDFHRDWQRFHGEPAASVV
jgi:hypothetical protein